jgi:hypothetical protein
MPEISALELRRHHRRARKASIKDYGALGVEHANEDALAFFAGLTLSDADAVEAFQRQRMADRTRRFIEAGVSQDRINAWLLSHQTTFIERLAELKRREQKNV